MFMCSVCYFTKVTNMKYQENPSGGNYPDACSLMDMTMPGNSACAFLNQLKNKRLLTLSC